MFLLNLAKAAAARFGFPRTRRIPDVTTARLWLLADALARFGELSDDETQEMARAARSPSLAPELPAGEAFRRQSLLPSENPDWIMLRMLPSLLKSWNLEPGHNLHDFCSMLRQSKWPSCKSAGQALAQILRENESQALACSVPKKNCPPAQGPKRL